MDEAATRAWCEGLARRLSRERIMRHGAPYLDRYFVAGWSPTNRQSGPAIFLHHFVASDEATSVHSHPWGWAAGLILVGGYREERCAADGTRTIQTFRPGDVNVLLPSDRHRVDLLQVDCWTLFLAGAYAQPWRFEPEC